LGALQASTFDAPHPLISACREHLDGAELDRFAWALFNGWLYGGTSPKEKWAMAALGLLGGDDTVNRLAPLVREWPGQSQHQRAVYGLECMRVIGTDTALLQINRIALKLKFKALQNRARECMEAIAASRGLTRPELEDRVVPDLGLDENGSRLFDYGSRQFTFAAGPDLKPMVREGTGKLIGDLPKPGAKDDPEKAPAALAEWKALKKSFREEVKVQAARLEQAMVTQRHWTAKDFESLILRHPFMSLPARLLVWGAWDAAGQPVGTFRITEDGTLGNSSDEPFDLSRTAAQVGIIHPLHLTPDDARAWGELFSDYAIVPPFPQIGRETHALEPGEEMKTEITRFDKLSIPPMALWGTFASHGWWRGIPQDAGAVLDHIKQFHSANITVVADHEPIYISSPQEGEEGPISQVLFYSGIRRPDDIPHWSVGAKPDELIALGKVDPVVLSEVLRDLYTIASKAK
ncbi:MAG: DUF4132 domain-containing protein, partial [Gemmatimonadetes bacterium]|nr:DUF4132 domain-containing protein [Gemmatimonadota bacterium]